MHICIYIHIYIYIYIHIYIHVIITISIYSNSRCHYKDMYIYIHHIFKCHLSRKSRLPWLSELGLLKGQVVTVTEAPQRGFHGALMGRPMGLNGI